ncbi:hypothetical protein GCM10023257_44490 [Streptomyces hyderabadensis]|uniref:Uncharacterized protein n=1 Tax=Streptomyces hyderabadensis TaxID=598549 RepID=A0ABP9IH13_9ACTN
MGPRVRLAYDNGAGQSVGDGKPGPRPRSGPRAGRRTRSSRPRFTMWETGLDKTGLDNFKPL